MEAVRWAIGWLNSNDYSISGEPEVVRTMPWSEVICFNTNIGFIFLKSMAQPFSNEPKLISYLSNIGIFHLPHIIAVNYNHKCFLMKNAGITMRNLLVNNYDIDLSISSLEKYSDIQISCIPYAKDLISFGVNDWRLKKLPELYKVFSINDNLLKSDGLTEKEIIQLQNKLIEFEHLCKQLEDFDIPETIEHGDFHDNNILISKDTITISDFGDASITHPFFSLVSFLDSLERVQCINTQDQRYNILRDAYLKKWIVYGHNKNLIEAFNLAKIIRDFVFSINCSRIKLCPKIEQFPEYQGYFAKRIRRLLNNL